jgi:site-specific DNA recombinase
MNVVIYARFSSHAQNEQSIEGQIKACNDYAIKQGFTVVSEYIDRAYSGVSDNRPEFQRMIHDSKKKQFSGVLVYQFDRFARNRHDSAINKSILKKNGVKVISVRENISEDASGILMEGLLESIAEYYSKELSQKIVRGMMINAEKGLCTGGNIALGYKINQEKRFVIDEEKSPIVVEIFKLYDDGKSITEIVNHLNSKNVKTSRGVNFNKNSIGKMLRNKRYIGIYTFKGEELNNSIPRIIEDDLFDRVQQLLAKNQKAPGRARNKNEYLLTTKLYCGHCNAMMTGFSGTSMTGKKHSYYICNNVKLKKCDKKSVRKPYIEDLVVGICRDLLTQENIEFIAREVVSQLETEEKNNTTLKHLNKQLKDNEKAIENLLKAIEHGQVLDLITDRILEKKKEKIEITKQIEKEVGRSKKMTVSEIKFFLNQIKSGDINDVKYRKLLINVFVSSIYVYDNKIVCIFTLGESKEVLDINLLNEETSSFIEPVAPPNAKTNR